MAVGIRYQSIYTPGHSSVLLALSSPPGNGEIGAKRPDSLLSQKDLVIYNLGKSWPLQVIVLWQI